MYNGYENTYNIIIIMKGRTTMITSKEQLLREFNLPFTSYQIMPLEYFYLYMEKEKEHYSFTFYFSLLNEIIIEEKKTMFELSLRKSLIRLDKITKVTNDYLIKHINPKFSNHNILNTLAFVNEVEAKEYLKDLNGSLSAKEIFDRYK